jgi:SWI/SNF-related matrix-associated actin-dependent regulator of chromatin subfamily A3
VKAQIRRSKDELSSSSPLPTAIGPSVALSISLVGDYFELLYEKLAFARLDKNFCSEARRLVDFGVRFHAYVDRKQWEGVGRAWTSYSTRDDNFTFAVEINVYSLRHHADKVGNILLRSGIFLQRPIRNDSEEHHTRIYYNPQILEVEGFLESQDEIVSEPDETPLPIVVQNMPTYADPMPSANSSDHVELILNSLSHTGILHEICTDANRIKSKLMG